MEIIKRILKNVKKNIAKKLYFLDDQVFIFYFNVNWND